jgi:DNA-binding IclR family transcriptional regulator
MVVKQISLHSGLKLSTCYHLLNTLIAAGYVCRDGVSQRFVLSGKLQFAQPMAEPQILVALRSQLQHLHHTSTAAVFLSTYEHGEIAIQGKIGDVFAEYTERLSIGYQRSNHATALGKAILAYLDEREIVNYLGRYGLPMLTEQTVREQGSLLAELQLVRQRGYSLDLQETLPRVCCVGAPVFHGDRVVASIGVLLPLSRFRASESNIIPSVIASAALASRTLSATLNDQDITKTS